MLDQDTARALLTLADEAGARVAFVGDRHQLPAVGRGGVLDHAVAWAHPTAVVSLEKVHRFADPDYAAAQPAHAHRRRPRRRLRPARRARAHRDPRLARSNAPPRSLRSAPTGDIVIADTRDQVAPLNAAIRDERPAGAHRTAD